jgi:Leucine-rich repeat (LRR) protein
MRRRHPAVDSPGKRAAGDAPDSGSRQAPLSPLLSLPRSLRNHVLSWVGLGETPAGQLTLAQWARLRRVCAAWLHESSSVDNLFPFPRHVVLRSWTQQLVAVPASASALRSLKLGCAMTDTGVASLSSLTALQSLDMSGCRAVTDTGVASLSSLTALQSLDMSGCRAVTDTGVASLSSLTALQSLNLRNCSAVTDTGVASLSSLTALQSLHLRF